MRPDLLAVAARNGGPFTRRDALSCGYGARELRTLTGSRGDWVVLRRGAYVAREVYDAADDDGRYLLRVRAAMLATTRAAVVSHGSAAVLLGMPLRPRWRELVHVTHPGVHGGRAERGVKHHRASLAGDRPVVRDGLRATGLARTGLDLAREYGFEDGVVALDAALRLGATRAELETCLRQMRCWPGSATARAAARFADGGAANPGESIMRVMIGELGLGPIQTQYLVTDGTTVAYADARMGRHLFEFDGRLKYLERERGGLADRLPGDVVWAEKRREDWLRRVAGGHGVSRVTWSEMLGTERRRTRERLRSEYLDTLRRFGT